MSKRSGLEQAIEATEREISLLEAVRNKLIAQRRPTRTAPAKPPRKAPKPEPAKEFV